MLFKNVIDNGIQKCVLDFSIDTLQEVCDELNDNYDTISDNDTLDACIIEMVDDEINTMTEREVKDTYYILHDDLMDLYRKYDIEDLGVDYFKTGAKSVLHAIMTQYLINNIGIDFNTNNVFVD